MRVLLASLLLCGCLQWEGDLMGLFLPRQSILVPLGLVTQPNQYGQYPSGALKIARNFVMRNPGELVQAPDVQSVQSVGAANNVLAKLMPLDAGHVYSAHRNGTTWSVFDINSSAALPSGTTATDLFSSTGFISPARVAERVLFNSNKGYLVGDFMEPSSAGERAVRSAGLLQPNAAITTTDSGNGFLPADHMVAYRACVVREFADSYALRSVPSSPVKLLNIAVGTFNPQLRFFWTGVGADAGLLEGDKFEVYRTNLLSTTSLTADPGSTFKRVAVVELTAADIVAGFVTVVDRQLPVTGTLVTPGEELYTNPGQESEEFGNRRPPMARTTASFKGFAFFGGTTERALLSFEVPGGIGSTATVSPAATVAYFRQYGIGTRVGAGTVTNGSAVITGVSAADLVGVKVGQFWFGPNPPFSTGGATVQAVGASTITMSAPATGAAAAWTLADAISINGITSIFADTGSISLMSGNGRFEVTTSGSLSNNTGVYTSGLEVSFERNVHPLNGTITVRATNGQNYSPPLPEIGATVKTITPTFRANRIQWSKEQQPEHAPSASEAFVGFGELYAMNSTRDALWIWCSDGLFRLSGDAGALGLGNWQIDYANSTLILAAPQASTVLNEFMYAYTNVGFVEVDSAGNVVNLTDKVIGDLLPGQKYIETAGIVVERNETDEEVLLILGENGNGSSNTVYVFNTKQRSWTTLGSNGANLTNITALAMQRSPVSGEPRTLFGVSPLAGGVPSYSGWNSTSAFLTAEVQYQPIYGDDPLDLKKWIWADYLFDAGSNAKTMVPTFNGTQYGGTVTIQTLDTNGAFARAGVPREVGLSHSISPGFRSLAGAPQSRFQGISIPVKPRTNQSKKR